MPKRDKNEKDSNGIPMYASVRLFHQPGAHDLSDHHEVPKGDSRIRLGNIANRHRRGYEESIGNRSQKWGDGPLDPKIYWMIFFGVAGYLLYFILLPFVISVTEGKVEIWSNYWWVISGIYWFVMSLIAIWVYFGFREGSG